MPSLRRSLLLLLSLAAVSLPAFGGEIGPFTGPEADAEAARLYERGNAFVNNVTEGLYSYAYIQFHWKRASANLDRIARAYPSSPTAALTTTVGTSHAFLAGGSLSLLAPGKLTRPSGPLLPLQSGAPTESITVTAAFATGVPSESRVTAAGGGGTPWRGEPSVP